MHHKQLDTSRPNISPFESLKMCRSAFLNYTKFVDRRISMVNVGKMFGQGLKREARERSYFHRRGRQVYYIAVVTKEKSIQFPVCLHSPTGSSSRRKKWDILCIITDIFVTKKPSPFLCVLGTFFFFEYNSILLEHCSI